MAAHKRLRILLVDDHRIVRDGISLLISREPDMEVVGSAANGEEAIALFRQLKPDVTLMDLQMPGVNGVDAIRAIRQDAPDVRIVVLTMYQGDEDIHRALQAGATAYLLKDALSDDLIRVIHDVHAGKHAIPESVNAALASRASQAVLTPREVAVVELISKGLRNKEIAVALDISEETVKVHVKNILAKLKVNDRSAVVAVAIRRGILHLN